MRDIIRKKKSNNTVVGLELKCFESAHLVVSALQQLRPPSAPLACDLQIIPRRVATVGGPRLLFVVVPTFLVRVQRFSAGGDEVCQFKSEVNILHLLSGGSNWRFFSLFPFLLADRKRDPQNPAHEQAHRTSPTLNIRLQAACRCNYHNSRRLFNYSSIKWVEWI